MHEYQACMAVDPPLTIPTWPIRFSFFSFFLFFFSLPQVVGSSLLLLHDRHCEVGLWMIDFGKTVEVNDSPVTHPSTPPSAQSTDG